MSNDKMNPIKPIINSDLSQSRAYTFIDSYIYMRNNKYNALYEKNKNILKIEAEAIREQSASMLYNAFIEQTRILDSTIARIRSFALNIRNDVINSIRAELPDLKELDKFNEYLKDNSPAIMYTIYKIEPIEYNDMRVFFAKARKELINLIDINTETSNVERPLIHSEASDFLIKAMSYADYNHGLLTSENIVVMKLSNLVNLTKGFVKGEFMLNKIQKYFTMFDMYLKSYVMLQDLVDMLKPTQIGDRIILKDVRQKSISFTDYLVIYKHFVNMVKYMLDIISFYDSKFFNKIYAIQSNIEMYNSLLVSIANAINENATDGILNSDVIDAHKLINGTYQAQLMLYDSANEPKEYLPEDMCPDDKFVDKAVLDISKEENNNSPTIMDAITDYERSMNEAYYKLESMHPIDIFNGEVLTEAIKVDLSKKKLWKIIIDNSEKFWKIAAEFKKKNSDWITESKRADISNKNIDGKYTIYPYWDGYKVIEKINIPGFNKDDYSIITENNGLGFKRKYFPQEAFLDNGAINKNYFRTGTNKSQEDSKINITNSNYISMYKQALDLLDTQDRISRKIYDENRTIVNVLQGIKDVPVNESFALSMSEFKSEYYDILLEAEDNQYSIEQPSNNNTSTNNASSTTTNNKDTASPTSPDTIEDEIDGKDVNKDDANKSKNIKDMNDAIMAYVKICYSVQSARMGMLDEALGNCIKFIQHIRNK